MTGKDIIIGIGVAIGVVVIYQKFVASTPVAPPPTPSAEAGAGLSGLTESAKKALEAVTGFFGAASVRAPEQEISKITNTGVESDYAAPIGRLEFSTNRDFGLRVNDSQVGTSGSFVLG